jgi:hypothetical protein
MLTMQPSGSPLDPRAGEEDKHAPMQAFEKSQNWATAEPTLAEELAILGDDGVVEMTNLQEEDTGVPGVIFISTIMGSHGPRVKYFLKAGRDQPSFSVSIAEEPKILANSLPQRTLRRAMPDVVAWVKLNRKALLRFWNEGDTWSIREVAAFVASLKKV